MKLHHTYRARQGGAALIISLIFLVLLTLIAVSAMQGTILQERMAGNTYNRMLAFQAAEAALSAGVATLSGASLPTGTGVYMNTSALPSANYVSTQDWVNIFPWSTGATTYATASFSPLVAQAPQYVIERLTTTKPSTCTAGGVQNITWGPGGSLGYYRITARGVGGTSNAVVILQEIYMRCN